MEKLKNSFAIIAFFNFKGSNFQNFQNFLYIAIVATELSIAARPWHSNEKSVCTFYHWYRSQNVRVK